MPVVGVAGCCVFLDVLLSTFLPVVLALIGSLVFVFFSFFLVWRHRFFGGGGVWLRV